MCLHGDADGNGNGKPGKRRKNQGGKNKEANTPGGNGKGDPTLTGEKQKKAAPSFTGANGLLDESKIRKWVAALDRDLEEGKSLLPRLRSLPGGEAKVKLHSFTADSVAEHVLSLDPDISTCM